MCGINGIFAYRDGADRVSPEELIRTRDHMRCRGPDGEGAWISSDGRIGLGHRRLSIIDLSEAGAQPMTAEAGALVVAFNGEIYNYQDLRRELEARGRVFRSHSDTEVLLHLYAEKGEGMLRDLRGMFAFAIHDAARGRLFLARDPYGIKPLYYADDARTFRFASQVKALQAGGAISRELEPAAQVGFQLWGSVPEPWTIYRDLRALPAGCSMTVDREGVSEPRPYHSIADVYRRAQEAASRPMTRPEMLDEMRAALRDSVSRHLIADVPVGAFLSAGIDSGALVGLMRDVGQNDIETVTLSFSEFAGTEHDEAPLAAEAARHYGARHTIRTVTEGEFLDDLPRILDAMDQPTVDGLNTWFVAKAARELGLKVAVSGVGGDELFGGYPSFRDIPRWNRFLAVPSRIPFAGVAARRVLGLSRRLRDNPKAAGLLELGGSLPGAFLLRRGIYMPWELDKVLGRELAREGLARLRPLEEVERRIQAVPGVFGKIATLESSLYMRNQLLRDTDWASMAHSLEIRTPLVDSVLLERLAPLVVRDDGPRKPDLAAAPSKPLPDVLSRRPKTGFSTPIAKWLLQQMPEAGGRASARAWARDWSRHVAASPW